MRIIYSFLLSIISIIIMPAVVCANYFETLPPLNSDGGDIYIYNSSDISITVLSDVFSDTILNAADWRASLRNTPARITEDNIKAAFAENHNANPNAVLYYEDNNQHNPTKRAAVYEMIKDLLAKGVPIGGVAIRGDFSLTYDITNLEAAINLFSELGIKIGVTLLEDDEYNTPQRQTYRAYQIARLFKMLSSRIDKIGYIKTNSIDPFFTADLSPKEAYYAVTDPNNFINESPAADIKAYKMLAVAQYELPLISERRDPIWDKVDSFNINGYITEDKSAIARAKVLWNSEFLFVLAQVEDYSLNDSSFDPWEKDSVIVYLNEGGGAYAAEDVAIYQVSCKNSVDLYGNAKQSGFLSSTYPVDNGYEVAMQIPLKRRGYIHNGQIGFDIQVINAKDGEMVSIARWNDITGMPADPARFGALILQNNRNKNTGALDVTGQIEAGGQSLRVKIITVCSVVVLVSAMCGLIYAAKKPKEVR